MLKTVRVATAMLDRANGFGAPQLNDAIWFYGNNPDKSPPK